MNWAKGRKTRGRGTSFKGALVYALHDKDAVTKDRVGFVELRNLATDDPDRAWSEMMALCEAADDLKRRAGVKATGRKMTKPVYAFTLNWHEEDRPEASHMRETALDALKVLGMDNLQAVIIEHTDRPHRHVHVIVNLVDPDNGKGASLSNDEHKLDRWADTYEQAQGVTRSPDRRAKFAALDQGRDPPKRPEHASSREEWEATRKLKGEEAKVRAAAIRGDFAARVAQLKAAQTDRFRAGRAEGDRLWNGYKADTKSIRDRYQPFIDAIYKSRRKAAPHPYTEQALHDMQESAEWKELGRRQFAKRKAFNIREHHLLGVIANAIRLHYGVLRRGGTSSLFMLAVSGKRRRQQFEQGQEAEKQTLRGSQGQRRKVRADTLRAACRHELAESAVEFRQSRKAMLDRRAGESAAQRAEWQTLAAERAMAWADFRRECDMRDLWQAEEAKSSLRQQFNGAASGKDVASRRSRKGGDKQGSQGNGTNGAPPIGKEAAGGWRKRRNAAERKDDGSYRPRDRSGRDRGRTR